MYRRKMGFSIPLAEWLRGPLKQKLQDCVTSPRLADTGIFNMTEIRKMADEHIAGTRDHNPALWSLLMFEAFLKHNAMQA